MRRILTVDLGGTQIRIGEVVGNSASVRNPSTYPSPGSLEGFLELIKSEVMKADGIGAPNYTGIAVAVAATLKDHQIVVNAPNLGFPNDCDLRGSVEKETGLSCVLLNDMEAAALGMISLLAESSLQDFVAITWSSGIGLRFVEGGKVVYANTELAHTLYDKSALNNPNAPVCGCGRRGCYEAYLGGKQLEKRIAQYVQPGSGLGLGEQFDRKYQEGTPWAISLGQEIAEGMGAFLGLVQSIAATRCVVWKGSFAENALPYLETSIREAMPHYMINPQWGKEDYLRFRFSPAPNLDALIGAASML